MQFKTKEGEERFERALDRLRELLGIEKQQPEDIEMPNQGQIPLKEKNNHKQGRAGSRVEEFPGPAAGGNRVNPVKSGGINRPTKGGSSTGA